MITLKIKKLCNIPVSNKKAIAQTRSTARTSPHYPQVLTAQMDIAGKSILTIIFLLITIKISQM